eukprot:TRINITY_DN3920_c0_g1_i1.p1 TRINITY_DN3920_c0_g1~~TRINITY_DN3920_c0_g1_i1.p1  ORF type:complete len:110 (+),score=16.93 TRINITY_DN3920_c0_g1_i1:342-671(+)
MVASGPQQETMKNNNTNPNATNNTTANKEHSTKTRTKADQSSWWLPYLLFFVVTNGLLASHTDSTSLVCGVFALAFCWTSLQSSHYGHISSDLHTLELRKNHAYTPQIV